MRDDSLSSLLDAIPRERIPAAIARLAARAMEVVPASPPPRPDGDRLLTPDEAAARLGVHRRRVYQLAAELGAVKLGRRTLRIPARALDAYLARRPGPP